MNLYEFKEKYEEASVILAHTGPYTIYDFFQYAIIRLAYTTVYGKGTGIYTCSTPEDSAAISSDGKIFIPTVVTPTKEDVLKVWDEYAGVIIPYHAIYDYPNKVRDNLSTLLSTDTSISMFEVLDMFNQTWSEANDELRCSGDMREVFRQRKKIMITGVNIASMIISRIIKKCEDVDNIQSMISSALESAINDGRNLGDDGWILILDEPYHMSNMCTEVRKCLRDSKIAIIIQTNQKYNITVSYFAKAISIDTITSFKLYTPEVFDDLNIKPMNDDGTAIGSFDLNYLIYICNKAYEHWKCLETSAMERLKTNSNAFHTYWIKTTGLSAPKLIVNDQKEDDQKENETINTKVPLTDRIKELINIIKESITNVWNNRKEPV